jgi:hypothetical protein
MWVAVAWLVLAIVVGVAASARGRSGANWFFLAVILSPLIAGLIVAMLPDLRTRQLMDEMRFGVVADGRALDRAVEKGQGDITWKRAIAIAVLLVAAAFAGVVVVSWLSG